MSVNNRKLFGFESGKACERIFELSGNLLRLKILVKGMQILGEYY